MGINKLKPYIFLSYAHEDIETVNKIFQYFSETNLPCWIDYKGLRGGDKFHDEIAKAIRDCSIFISVISSTYLEKEFCSHECTFSSEQHKNALCIYIEEGVTVNTNHGLGIQFLYSGKTKPGFNIKWSDDEHALDKLFEEIERTPYIKAFRNHLLNGDDSIMPYLNEQDIPFNTLLNNSKKVYSNTGNYVIGEIRKELFPKFEVVKKEDASKNNNYGSSNDNLGNIIDFIEKNHKNNILMLGDGGVGKTVSLLNIMEYYNENYLPAIYVPLQSIYFDHPRAIEEYIKENVLKDEYLKDIIPKIAKYTNNLVIKCEKDGEVISNKFRLLVFLDGFNEIHTGKIQEAKSQIRNFLDNWPEAQCIIASRNSYINAEEFDPEIKPIRLLPLDISIVQDYLEEKNIYHDLPQKTFNLIRNPLMLSLFASSQSVLAELLTEKGCSNPYIDVDLSAGLDSSTKIIWAFLLSQLYKSEKGRSSLRMAECHAVIEFLLPALAVFFTLVDNPEDFNRKYISNFINSFLENNEHYKIYVKDRLTDIKQWYDYTGSIELINLIGTAIKELNILVYKDETKEILDFTHQEFRDFFAAVYYSNEIKNIANSKGSGQFTIGKIALKSTSVNADIIEASLINQTIIENCVVAYIIDILKENTHRPICDEENQIWDYQCNDHSVAYKCLDNLRGSDHTLTCANIINILKKARDGDLSGGDFSDLDLTNCDLQGCIFSRFYDDTLYPSNFKNAIINKENLIFEGHYSALGASCCSAEKLATADAEEKIILWDINNTTAPLNVITHAGSGIKKMLFSPDGNALYVMTNHEIYQVAISNEPISVAKKESFFKSPELLRDIKLDDHGQLFFTTAINAFNFKPISNPCIEDEIKFSSINSGGAVNHSKTQLAFGHIAAYKGVAIYDYDAEMNAWVIRDFGYSKILKEFLSEIVCVLSENNCYNKGVEYFLSHLKTQFEEPKRKCENVPDILLNSIYWQFEKKFKNKYFVVNSLKPALSDLALKYKNHILKLKEENPLLLRIVGREINSISYHNSKNVLLLSCVKEITDTKANKTKYDSFVIELNTETFQTKLISWYIGPSKLSAHYSNNQIIVTGNYSLYIFDEDGRKLAGIYTRSKDISFIYDKNPELLYAISQHYIYVMNDSLVCVRAINNSLGTYNLAFCSNGDCRYLVKTGDISNKDQLPAIDLANGTLKTIKKTETLRKEVKVARMARYANKGFRCSGGKILSFIDSFFFAQTDIYYKLIVSGCDFTNIKGSLSAPQYASILNCYGAYTNAEKLGVSKEPACLPAFVSSKSPFSPPDECEAKISPFSDQNKQFLKLDSCSEEINQSIKSNAFVFAKWKMISTASFYNGCLTSSDYSILEWIGRLRVATAEMIFKLMEAHVVEKPSNYTYELKKVNRRILETLHNSFNLLTAYDGASKRKIYSVSDAFGKIILENIATEQFYLARKLTFSDIMKTLALNQWFCETMLHYNEYLQNYDLYSVFSTDYKLECVADVHGYIKLNEQAFWAQEFRCDNLSENDIQEKIERLCLLASNYPSLTKKHVNEFLTKPPIIVIIGESYEHCIKLNKIICDIIPKIRKIYTYDALLHNDTVLDHYFEFLNDDAFALDLKSLI